MGLLPAVAFPSQGRCIATGELRGPGRPPKRFGPTAHGGRGPGGRRRGSASPPTVRGTSPSGLVGAAAPASPARSAAAPASPARSAAAPASPARSAAAPASPARSGAVTARARRRNDPIRVTAWRRSAGFYPFDVEGVWTTPFAALVRAGMIRALLPMLAGSPGRLSDL